MPAIQSQRRTREQKRENLGLFRRAEAVRTEAVRTEAPHPDVSEQPVVEMTNVAIGPGAQELYVASLKPTCLALLWPWVPLTIIHLA